MGAHPGEQRGDRIPVPHDHPVHAAHLAGLREDAEPAGRAHEREGGLRAGAGELHRGGAAGLREGAVGQEGPAQHRFGVGHGPVDHGGREPAHGAPARVEQSRLAGEGLAVLDDAHHVGAPAPQSPAGDDHDLAVVAEDLVDGAAHPARGGAEVHLRLDDDASRDDVEPTREAQQGGELGAALRGPLDLEAGQFFLHR